MDKNEFTELLKGYRENFEEINSDEVFFLTKEAMKYIGDADPTIRDNLVYPYIEHVINSGLLKPEEIKEISTTCLENITIKCRKFDDSIFCRTFSMLVIAAIINYHRKNPVFSLPELEGMFNRVIDSYQSDFDVRGYINKKGWAHGAAHGADALLQFAMLREANAEMLLKILFALQKKATISYYGYIHNEDDRMARVAVAVLKRRQISDSKVFSWLQRFRMKKEKSYSNIIRKNNIRSFLSCLYFRLYGDNRFDGLNQEIAKIIISNN
jgi:hypothetical protein